MSLMMSSLLIHSESIPAEARSALKAASEAPADQRTAMLRSVARILHHATGLECADVRELVDLPPTGTCE